MEIMLRCAVPDRPGALASLAGAIADAGGDIHAVDVVDSDGGIALDDLVVVITPGGLPRLLASVEAIDGIEIVHVGPSRGHPGDAATRLALGLESLLNGAMDPDHGIATLLGGLLRASSVTLVQPDDAPGTEDERTMVLPCDGRVVVVRRGYRFTHTERERGRAVLRVCLEALRAGGRRAPLDQLSSSSG
jgi:hypothetical protein